MKQKTYKIGYTGIDCGDHATFTSKQTLTQKQLKQKILKATKTITTTIHKNEPNKIYKKEPILFPEIYITHFQQLKTELKKQGLHYQKPQTEQLFDENEDIGSGNRQKWKTWFDNTFTPWDKKQKNKNQQNIKTKIHAQQLQT